MSKSLTTLLNALCAGGFWFAATIGDTSAQEKPSTHSGMSAAEPKAVLELYTSQGCNSCPPADALLERYVRRGDVVALTLPVDIWDYLGWKDTLASPKHTARQRAYAKERGDGRIYTPQLVVNGVAHVVGSSARDIDKAIEDTAPRFSKSHVPLKLRSEGGHIVIEAGDAPAEASVREATIWLAVIQKQAEVPVRTGENHGRSLKYFNVVRELTAVGMWTGKAARFELARDAVKHPETESCAALIQSGKAGPIVGAAMLESF